MCHGVSAATRAGVVWSGVLVLTGPHSLQGMGPKFVCQAPSARRFSHGAPFSET